MFGSNLEMVKKIKTGAGCANLLAQRTRLHCIAQLARKWKRKIVVADLTNPIISAGKGLISAGLTP